MDVVLDFERPIVELHKRILQLKNLQDSEGVNLTASIGQLEVQARKLQEQIFTKLSPWQRAQLARHPHRPYMLDYIDELFFEFNELHGDRAGYDDAAIITGMARFKATHGDEIDQLPVIVIGHQKGRNTKENLLRNFGMARPDGYRKALRVMQMASNFGLPIITFIDTPGAYPGIDAEERGQAEAIAMNILKMASFKVPIIAIVTGEGGSGGALAIGVANRVIMLENSIYSVISPEGCAAILWRDRAKGPAAAKALRITAADCMELGVIDEVVAEPLGGAHRYREESIHSIGDAIRRHLSELLPLDAKALVDDRYNRFRKMGKTTEVAR